jgi:hypothetical protein
MDKRDIFTNMLWLLAIICIINIMIMNTGCAKIGKCIDLTLMATTPYVGDFCEDIGDSIDDAKRETDDIGKDVDPLPAPSRRK